jgi:quercetin dioxygenase-like cupin family protein
MPVRKYADVEEAQVTWGDAVGVSKKIPIGKTEGWEGYTLRVFRIAPGGHTPKHLHDWEHVNYVISGRGRLTMGDVDHEIAEKDFALVPPNTGHQFQNPYDKDLEFICIVPNRGEF